MSADDALMTALQAAHDLEATASEKWHKQEHAWKQGERKYPKLKKYFHCLHRAAFNRQHDLRGWMMRLGGTVETKLDDTSYTDDPEKAHKDACALLDNLRDAHDAVKDAAKAAGDSATREKFHGVFMEIKKSYHRGKQELQRIKDLGKPLYLSTKL